jgi:MFS family permease
MPLVLNSIVHPGSTATALSAADASFIARYATLPYVAASLFLVLVGWSSDRTGDRRWHIAGCLLLSAIGFGWAGMAHSLVAALCAFSLAAMGWWSIMGPFWALPTRVLGGRGAAGGVAIITMVGGVGGFIGPYLTGRLRDLTHSFADGLFAIGALAVLAAALSLFMRQKAAAGAPEAAR